MSGARRPAIEIPEEWRIDYAIGRLLKGGLGVTWPDLRDWKYSWEEIWKMHDLLDLDDWINWESHVLAERIRGNG